MEEINLKDYDFIIIEKPRTIGWKIKIDGVQYGDYISAKEKKNKTEILKQQAINTIKEIWRNKKNT